MRAPLLTEYSYASMPAEASGIISGRPGSRMPLFLPAATPMSASKLTCRSDALTVMQRWRCIR